MSYFGKQFVLHSQENLEEFLNSFGDKVPADVKPLVLKHKGTAKFEKNGDEFSLTTSQPTGGDKKITFKSGVEMEDDLGGVKAKTTHTVAGDTLTTVMKFDNGVTFTITRQFSDNQLNVTIASSTGVSAKRVYKA